MILVVPFPAPQLRLAGLGVSVEIQQIRYLCQLPLLPGVLRDAHVCGIQIRPCVGRTLFGSPGIGECFGGLFMGAVSFAESGFGVFIGAVSLLKSSLGILVGSVLFLRGFTRALVGLNGEVG